MASDEKTDAFYDKLDAAKGQGRGSCCTGWSFVLLFGTLLVLAGALLFFGF